MSETTEPIARKKAKKAPEKVIAQGSTKRGTFSTVKSADMSSANSDQSNQTLYSFVYVADTLVIKSYP